MLSSYVLSSIGNDVLLLGANNIGCIVGVVACRISGSVGGRVGRGVGGSIGSAVDRLHYFVFTSSLLRHGLKGALL
jgi:hypothetical protein